MRFICLEVRVNTLDTSMNPATPAAELKESGRGKHVRFIIKLRFVE